jgi:uncharacterized membrane protein/osmotically-inducible protein OsmY
MTKHRNRGWGLIGGLGLGAALMYAFDPLVGRRRRALARDKATSLARKTATAIDVTSRDLKNRAIGLWSEAKRRASREEVDDSVLAERVRSKLGFLASHPASIAVRAENGKVVLEGAILADEVDRLIRGVSSVRGVKRVENRLEAHESAGGVPALQGRPARPRGELPDVMQRNWAPATRFVAGTLGGALVGFGARRRGIFGAALAGLGLGVVARALTNIELERLIGLGAGRRAIDIQKIIHIAAPVEEVFAFWSNYENFPRFMRNVREVRDLGNDRSRWVVAGPAGAPIEWDAEITSYVQNQRLGWRTLPGSPIQHAGIVLFERNPDGTTRLNVRMSYNPVAGALGHAVASLLGSDPKSEMDEELLRMKTMIETGVPPHDAAQKEKGGYVH